MISHFNENFMKKIMVIISICMLISSAGNSQTLIPSCEIKHDKVCRPSADKKKTICYETKFSENFSVCKNMNGYYICCETPTRSNSTFTDFLSASKSEVLQDEDVNQDTYIHPENAPKDKSTPQNQSYINTNLSNK
jgi:hypothetical protein